MLTPTSEFVNFNFVQTASRSNIYTQQLEESNVGLYFELPLYPRPATICREQQAGTVQGTRPGPDLRPSALLHFHRRHQPIGKSAEPSRCASNDLLNLVRRFLLLIAWAVTNTAWAAPGIDAGSLFQQMEREQRESLPPPSSPGISPFETPVSGSAQDKELRFTVQKIILLNVTAFDEDILVKLLADTVGQPVSLAELREHINHITDYYHAHGYPAAYAYLPEQAFADGGAVEVRVLEGYLGEIHLHNQSRLTDTTARARFPEMKTGDLLRQAELERAALLVNDIPGIAAQTVFNPGKDTGFTDVDITLIDKPLLTAQLTADNQGNRYTGNGNRFAVRTELSNLTGYGDKLIANLLYGGFGMKYNQLQYQLPTYWTGEGRAGFELGEVRYQLGREFLASRSQGSTSIASLYGSYPVLRSDSVNFDVEVRLQKKIIRDEVLSVNDINERRSYGQSLGINESWRDSGINLLNATYTTGNLDFANMNRLAMDAASAKTSGRFSKYNWNYTRVQPVSGLRDTNATLSLIGQINLGRNLDSAEKMALGGTQGVRAYPSSEGTSDQATLATIELKHQFNSLIQGSIFYDYGNGIQNSHPWPAVSNTNKTEIAGTGVGLRLNLLDHGYLSMQIAWRITHIKPAFENDKPNGRVWLEMGWGL